MNTDNLEGLVNFHAMGFPAPKDVKSAFAQGIKAYEDGGLSNVERVAYLGAKKLADTDGKVGAAWIRKGLEWWETRGGEATEEERNLFGGEKGRAWFEKCARELEARAEKDVETDADFLTYKSLDGQVTDVDSLKGIVTGYAAKKNNWDAAKEMIMDGSMERSIKSWGPKGSDRIKALYQHQPALLIGRPLELKEDANGLHHVTHISKTTTGSDVIRLIADGILTEQSIGYTVLDAEPSEEKSGHWHLKELKLFEYSFVTWGANEFTPIQGIKSATAAPTLFKAMKEMMDNCDRALRYGEWQTDEVPVMVGLMSKKLNFMMKQLEETVVGEDNFEAAKPILLKTVSNGEPGATEDDPKPEAEPESEADDAEIVSMFKSAKFVPDESPESIEEDLRLAFKSFQFVPKETTTDGL